MSAPASLPPLSPPAAPAAVSASPKKTRAWPWVLGLIAAPVLLLLVFGLLVAFVAGLKVKSGAFKDGRGIATGADCGLYGVGHFGAVELFGAVAYGFGAGVATGLETPLAAFEQQREVAFEIAEGIKLIGHIVAPAQLWRE